MANMMSSHTSLECRGSDGVLLHRQQHRPSTQDASIEVNRPSVEGAATEFNHCYNSSWPVG